MVLSPASYLSTPCADLVRNRKAERKHLIANANSAGVSDHQGIETVAAFNLHQCEVRCCVPLQHVPIISAPVGQPDTYAALSVYDVLTGDYQSVRVADEARLAAAVRSNLHHASLDSLDELVEREVLRRITRPWP